MSGAANRMANAGGDLHSLAQVLADNPNSTEDVKAFAIACQNSAPQNYTSDIASAVMIALRSQVVPAQMMVKPWFAILSAADDFKNIFALAQKENFTDFVAELIAALDNQNLAHPLFLAGLEQLTIPALVPERFFTYLRRSLWNEEIRTLLEQDTYISFAAAMACYCFHTGYIMEVTEEEQEDVTTLADKLETEKEIALYACYELLHKHADAKAIYDRFKDSPVLARAIEELLHEQLEDMEIAAEIETLTPITDKTSLDVQEQYIDFPYPRWKGTIPNNKIESSLEPLRNEELDILVAGCGTGRESMRMRNIFPASKILAVDLSPASLAYAIRKAEEVGAKNIEFKLADILALPEAIDRQFDLISSSGVIHHMEDPEAGFAALDKLLKPGGILCLALYSRIGRQHISKAHKIIAEKGYGNTADEMRRFRKDAPWILPQETFNGLLRSRDFFIMPQLRDLLFHVMEHQFSLTEIDALLGKYSYQFEEFLLPSAVLQKYKSRFPGDTEAKSLRNWDLFEKAHPRLFEAMYRFVCRKTD